MICRSPKKRFYSQIDIVASSSRYNHLSKHEVARIFHRKVRINRHGDDWVPTNLPADHPLRLQFSQCLFRQAPMEMQDYWNARYFHGILPPGVVDSEEAMLRFVANTPGAIGYILSSHLDRRVKIVFTLTSERDNATDTLECNNH
jgi:hypothetical protein